MGIFGRRDRDDDGFGPDPLLSDGMPPGIIIEMVTEVVTSGPTPDRDLFRNPETGHRVHICSGYDDLIVSGFGYETQMRVAFDPEGQMLDDLVENIFPLIEQKYQAMNDSMMRLHHEAVDVVRAKLANPHDPTMPDFDSALDMVTSIDAQIDTAFAEFLERWSHRATAMEAMSPFGGSILLGGPTPFRV